MDTPHPLLHSIRDDILDDAPRLILADWLEEQGDSDRAEFIRVQCELARLEFANNWNVARCTEENPQYPYLKQREQELLQRHQKEWLGALGLAAGVFYRGFLHVPNNGCLDFQFQPSEEENQARRLGRSVDLLKVLRLGLRGERALSVQAVQELADGWGLTQVQSLLLSDPVLNGQGLALLLSSPWLSELRSLLLGHHPGEHCSPLMTPRMGENLFQHRLRWDPALMPALLQVLADAPLAARLRYLAFPSLEQLTPPVALAMVDSPHLPNRLLLSASGSLSHLPTAIQEQFQQKFHLDRLGGWNTATS